MISAEAMKQAATNGSMKPPSDHVTDIVNAQYRAASAAASSAAPRIGIRIGEIRPNCTSGFGRARHVTTFEFGARQVIRRRVVTAAAPPLDPAVVAIVLEGWRARPPDDQGSTSAAFTLFDVRELQDCAAAFTFWRAPGSPSNTSTNFS